MTARAFQTVLLGRDKFFRAEVDFEIDGATADVEDAADEEADRIAALLMPVFGRIDVDAVYEITRARP